MLGTVWVGMAQDALLRVGSSASGAIAAGSSFSPGVSDLGSTSKQWPGRLWKGFQGTIGCSWKALLF